MPAARVSRWGGIHRRVRRERRENHCLERRIAPTDHSGLRLRKTDLCGKPRGNRTTNMLYCFWRLRDLGVRGGEPSASFL